MDHRVETLGVFRTVIQFSVVHVLERSVFEHSARTVTTKVVTRIPIPHIGLLFCWGEASLFRGFFFEGRSFFDVFWILSGKHIEKATLRDASRRFATFRDASRLPQKQSVPLICLGKEQTFLKPHEAFVCFFVDFSRT